MSATNQNQEIDSLKIIEQPDGTFQMEWDKEDPKWSFLNHLTSAEIQVIMEQAIKDHLEELNSKND
jgi:hypothetical protein